ncbi:MAG: cytochrome c [Deltaproteobacteria bacterium]|nr:cytochrome c [Deltaproteobacteria bacterium]
MTKYLFLSCLLYLATAGYAMAADSPAQDPFKRGEAAFNANCARCHGVKGGGTDKGPPLVHKIYQPNHHADISFRWAVERGVRAHHWPFGDMPKIEGVSKDDVENIIFYVRAIQRDAGIY